MWNLLASSNCNGQVTYCILNKKLEFIIRLKFVLYSSSSFMLVFMGKARGLACIMDVTRERLLLWSHFQSKWLYRKFQLPVITRLGGDILFYWTYRYLWIEYYQEFIPFICVFHFCVFEGAIPYRPWRIQTLMSEPKRVLIGISDCFINLLKIE